MDNFKIIYRILKYLEKAMDYEEPDLDFISFSKLGISEHRWTAIMEMLVNEGYITGVEVKRSVDGDMCMSVCNMRITMKGLEYLQENSLMKKASNMAKGIAGVIS